MSALRRHVFHVLEEQQKNRISQFINFFLWGLIATNVLVVILESEASIQQQYSPFFLWFERLSIICFSIEYGLRVWASIEHVGANKMHPIRCRIRYMLTPMGIIDLVSVLPFYLSIFLGISDLRVLSTLRLLRILKLTRYSRSMSLLTKVLKQEFEHIISALFMLSMLIVLAASGISLVEGDGQPEQFGSIPRALWWAMVTLTTVGYGDAVPLTLLGKLFSAIVTIGGVAVAALPAGILASGLMNELDRRRDRYRNEVREAYLDYKVDFHEWVKLEKCRVDIGLSRADARLILQEVKQESRLITHKNCPYCSQSLTIQHPAGLIKVTKKGESSSVP